jgi:hypothetical protein
MQTKGITARTALLSNANGTILEVAIGEFPLVRQWLGASKCRTLLAPTVYWGAKGCKGVEDIGVTRGYSGIDKVEKSGEIWVAESK